MFKTFEKLIKRYEEITREEIAKEVCRRLDWNIIKKDLTGFADPASCILCQNVGCYEDVYTRRCESCDWVKLTKNKCHGGDNHATYCQIMDAQTIEKLYQAYKDRAKYMKKVLKEYKEKHQLPEIGKCPFCGSEHVRVETVAPLSHCDQTDYFKIKCMRCKSNGPVEFTERKAIEGWNTVLSKKWDKMEQQSCKWIRL